MRLGGSTKKNHVRLLARCCFPVTQLPLSTLCQQSQTTQDLQRTNKQTQGAPHPTPLFSPVTPHSLIPPPTILKQTNKHSFIDLPNKLLCTALSPSPPDPHHPTFVTHLPTFTNRQSSPHSSPTLTPCHSRRPYKLTPRRARVRSRRISGSDS